MANSDLQQKLKQLRDDTAEIYENLTRPGVDILPDDEFEIEILMETLAKNVNQFKKISHRCVKASSAAQPPEEEDSSPACNTLQPASSGTTQAFSKPRPHKAVNKVTGSFFNIEETPEKSTPVNVDEDTPPTRQRGKVEDDGDSSDSTVDYDEDKDKKDSLPRISSPSPVNAVDINENKHDKTEEVSKEDIKDLMSAFEADDEQDGFDDDLFDDSALQIIDDAEKSYTEESQKLQQDDDDYDPANQPQDQKYLDVLKQYFGFGKFRPLQWKIINSILNDKRDNCVIMATGYGKSLCYQYPSVFTGRVTFVISPLISLMQDQVMALSAVNVNACFMGSAQDNNSKVRSQLFEGHYRVVYLTPEFLGGAHDLLKKVNESVGIDLIAVDEAHCVSQWGHDFRSAYRSVGEIHKVLPKVPMMALTATATPEVRSDICRSLHLRNPLMSCTSFDRPNLYLSVAQKSGEMSKDLRSQMVQNSKGKLEFSGPTIIYCPTKKTAEDVHNMTKVLGIKSALYHAGLSLSVRRSTHYQFVNDEIQAVVATVAFGMGIDKPDVRHIIHFGAPRDIESYYQEIGRAGRDGQDSSCHVFYAMGDFNTNRFFLSEIKSEKFRSHKQQMFRRMEEYLSSTKCRRRAILTHFESGDVNEIGGTERCCDNCTLRRYRANAPGGGQKEDERDEMKNYGKEARDLMKAIETTGSRYGLAVPVFLLRGSSNSRLPQRYSSHPDYGSGKYRSEKWWKVFSRMLTLGGYLEEEAIQGGFGCTVHFSRKGENWFTKSRYSSDPILKLQPSAELLNLDKERIKPEISVAPKKKKVPTATLR